MKINLLSTYTRPQVSMKLIVSVIIGCALILINAISFIGAALAAILALLPFLVAVERPPKAGTVFISNRVYTRPAHFI
ncbi:MAG: hypothetical protein ACYS8W_12200 [Planctomycetota bacterium]|jgi:hypothetical protein